VFLIPAIEVLSNYQYEGARFSAAALAYLIVRFGLALVDTASGSPDRASAVNDGGGGTESADASTGSDAGG